LQRQSPLPERRPDRREVLVPSKNDIGTTAPLLPLSCPGTSNRRRPAQREKQKVPCFLASRVSRGDTIQFINCSKPHLMDLNKLSDEFSGIFVRFTPKSQA
jgi:hypothetical protein